MRLYHFTSEIFGLEAIEKRRLKIARINELNDPFEFLGWNIRCQQTRDTLKKWKRSQCEKLGILCFSSKWSNPLLWSHYADKHKGMALGFDVLNDELLSPVKYYSSRPPAPSGNELDSEGKNHLLLIKFNAWRYESEYRRFCCLEHSDSEDGLFFSPFSPSLKLAQVIIGDQASITRAKLAAALGDQKSHVTSFKARPAFGNFSVVKNLNATLWK